ncbi:hypothetical protein P170DRAFT_422544 [Aspergillus steynii IBT 23096]|uniref:Copper transport protein n=1 Tax=Aspergillus steynii IBT 23096 TaxID=1392250 RepID=A0A2I2GF78_9EURO|nr:uncharacterized protein P170DRAFT_422544 [Aspergillus steynii IBT 23096]PLB51535.1 hypothetical protein P170DRAFT_422544 [Aspergillus steynii IBT 23096]
MDPNMNMNMDMDMHHHHQPSTTAHASSTTTPNAHHESSMSMEMSMPTVFTATTQVTILFTGWTTNSVPSYVLTLLVLFVLAILNRFLTAWKSQLERSWNLNQQGQGPKTVTLSAVPRRTGSRIAKERLSPLPRYMRIDEESHTDHHCGHDDNDTGDNGSASLLGRLRKYTPAVERWQASRKWSVRRDGLFSVLECVKAGIGYFL